MFLIKFMNMNRNRGVFSTEKENEQIKCIQTIIT
jgi:hypothetical protein